MATHKIEIQAIPPVAFAVPGIRRVRTGDTINFHNKTGGPVKISMAADNVLKGTKTLKPLKLLKPMLINQGQKKAFEVMATDGTHEFSVHYNYLDKQKKKRRTGFAIGASSPKIIIDR